MLNQNTLISESARMLQDSERDDIIVIDYNHLPIGIVTDEDIINKISEIMTYAKSASLKDIMSTPLITISEKTTLQEHFKYSGFCADATVKMVVSFLIIIGRMEIIAIIYIFVPKLS